MKNLIYYLCVLSLLFTSCKKTGDSNVVGATGSMDLVFQGSHQISNVYVYYDQSSGSAGLTAGNPLTDPIGVSFAYTGTSGSFQFGDQSKGNVDFNVITNGSNSHSYYTHYNDCNTSAVKYTTGTLNISLWGPVNGEVRGTFSGQVADKSNCTPVLIPVSGTFSAIRKL